MRLTPRQKKILNILSTEQEYITVKKISNRLNISSRTVHYELQKLSDFENNFQIIKKRGVGIKLKWLEKVEDSTLSKTVKDESLTRAKAIYKRLLFDEEILTIAQLSEELYVSPSSIINDIKLLKNKYLSNLSCEVVSDSRGTFLKGDEQQWQKSMLLFNDRIRKEIIYITGLKSFQEELSKYYGDDIVDPIYELIQTLYKYNLYNVAPHYEMNILSVLVVMVYRLKKDKQLEFVDEILKLDEILAMKYFLIAKDILDKLSKTIEFEYSDLDIYSLSIYLQANRLEFSPSRSFIDERFSIATKNMIERMSITVNANLRDDDQLYKDVLVHIYHMVYRMEHKIYIENPLLEQIKVDFRLMYDLVWLVLNEEKDYLGIEITDDELGFLMLHFQSALDRTEKSKRILVVCPNGVVSSNFIIERLKSNFPPLDVIELTSLSKLETVATDNVDLIISTVPIPNLNTKVVVISPLVTESDIKKINLNYRNIIKSIPKQENLIPKNIAKYMDKDLIFVDHKLKTPNEIIKHVTKVLEHKNYVNKKYYQSVLDREKQGSTELTTNAAVPHGSIEYVNKTVIPIYVNKNGVKWGDSVINFALFFVIAKKDLSEAKVLLQDVFKLIKSEVMIENELINKTESELYTLFLGGNYDK